jgi:hypothetical protein
MNLNILNNKRTVTYDGVERVDLCDPVLGKSSNGIRVIDLFRVVDMEMRPDLLSHAAYRSPDFFDFILKFNGISNPYSLDRDQLIFIPELSDFKSKFDTVIKSKDDSDNSDFNIRSQYIDKKTNIDTKRSEYHTLLQTLKNKGMNVSNEILPPNIQETGKAESVIQNDKVILGI